MADDLRRVGLVFKEDGAVDFKKSLQEVNLELNKNYNQFKLTQAQWDKSTKSTEKLRAEQDYLTNAYEIQADKVSTLKMQLDDLENAENKDISAIKKKRNELTAAEVKLETYKQKIKDIENQLQNSGKKIEEFGKNIEKLGNGIEKAGKKLSVFSAATASAFVASAKSAIDFEDAFTGVEKTVDGTAEQMENLKQGIRNMAKEIPSSTTEISAVAEAAGQLGIKTEDILSFTKVMIDLGNSTNLSAEEAASSLAKFANITNMSAKDYDKLGSTIVALGNNFATTEADIVAMSTRLAATGELSGLSQSQILSLATAMSSVGIEAEAGGSAMSKLLKKIQVAVETSSKDLKDYAKVAGMTSKEFKKAFEEDAVGALSAFISGLNDTERNGKSAITILEDMGLTEVRLSNTILSLANASGVMTDAVELGGKAWEDNTALTNEANKRYGTLKSQIQITVNKLKDLAITIGNKLTPVIPKVIKQIEKFTKWVENLDDKQVKWILRIGQTVIAIGPLVTILGKITKTLGTTAKGIGTFVQALEVASGTAKSTSMAVNALAKVIGGIVSPVGMACTLVGVAIAGIAISAQNSTKQTKEAFSNIGDSANDFIEGIKNAKSHLDDFNSTLFASAEEQENLKEQMKEVQQGITNICKTASDERRGYTQEEITQLDEYFEKLRILNQREIEIQQSIAGAITQQAKTTAETFKGTTEEFKIQSQEWIKTAQEQKDRTINLIQNQTIEEVALLNQRFGEEANMQNEAYATEYNKIMENKQSKIDSANDEVAKVSEIYSKGYFERIQLEEGFYDNLKQYMKEQENLEQAHSKKIEQIKNGELWYVTDVATAIQSENETFAFHQRETWNKMYKDMDESQAKQLGIWLAMQSQTELYGGEINNETKEMVNKIMQSYESMPEGTRNAMKNALNPMLEEMQNKEPSLFAKAKSIGDGIINRLRKAFDEHSPSKLTRKIMKFAMTPMEEELEEGKKELFKQAEELGKGVTDRLKNVDGDVKIKGTTDEAIEGKENNKVLSMLFKANDQKYQNIVEILSKIIELLTKILAKNPQIVMDSGALVGEIIEPIDQEMGNRQGRKERGN